MTRRRWIAGVAGAVLAGTAVDAFAIEPAWVSVTRYPVGPAGGLVIRVVQLSDLHLREIGRHEERVAATVAELRPDVIVLTGDAIDRAGDVALLMDFLRMMPNAAHMLAILGNWEHWAGVDVARLTDAYDRSGWQLLRNESVTLPFGSSRMLVTGLDDLVGGRPDVPQALRGVTPVFDHLVLAHCPMHRDVYASAARSAADARLLDRVDPRLLKPRIMLSGHTHGGQVAPFGWAPLRPRGSGRYVRGWYHDGGFPLYVSRGIGTSVIPARLGSTPEIALFEWGLARDSY